jgi:poly(beta-D-mannuronate) lyase
MLLRAALTVMIGVSAVQSAAARDILVADQIEYKAAVKAAKPGDSIILRDGEWRDAQLVFTGAGTADKPITLTAQTKGKVLLTGASNLRLGGSHLLVSGLVFKHGFSPTDQVISFRRDSKTQRARRRSPTSASLRG